MRAGEVIGVRVSSEKVTVAVYGDGWESSIELCRSDRAACVRPGDHLWTQSENAMWSSHDLGLNDVPLPIHQTMWDESHPCCDKSN